MASTNVANFGFNSRKLHWHRNWSFDCSKGVAQSIWQRGGETSLENLCDFYVKTRQVGSNVGVIFVSMHCDIAMCVSLLSVPDGILVISKLCTLNIYVSVIESQSFDLHLKYYFKKMR